MAEIDFCCIFKQLIYLDTQVPFPGVSQLTGRTSVFYVVYLRSPLQPWKLLSSSSPTLVNSALYRLSPVNQASVALESIGLWAIDHIISSINLLSFSQYSLYTQLVCFCFAMFCSTNQSDNYLSWVYYVVIESVQISWQWLSHKCRGFVFVKPLCRQTVWFCRPWATIKISYNQY